MIPAGMLGFALLAVSSLFAITNPVSAAPVYLVLTEDYGSDQRRRTLRLAVLTGAAVLLTFALLGGAIFRLFGITIEAFRIAGGIIIFGIGMRMLQSRRDRLSEEDRQAGLVKEDVAITPLGIPIIVGPGAITTVMVLMTEATTAWHLLAVLAAIAIVLGSIYIALRAAPSVTKRLGPTGIEIMNRLMGLLLTVIAVQFVVDGVWPILVGALREAGV